MIIKKFEEQVRLNLKKIAVKTVEKELTYELLNSSADKVSNVIRKKYNNDLPYSKEDVVALLFGHGIDMIVGTIGALKSGKIYVPFDPSYPFKRLLYMLEDSESQMIITNNENLEIAEELVSYTNKGICIINIDEIDYLEPSEKLQKNSEGKDIAYILYTSGSTGKPKGVVQTQEHIIHFIKCYTEELSITKEDKMTLFSAFSHDATIMDIYGALLNGATLYPLNIRKQGNINEVARWLQKEEITIWHSVPTLYRYFINTLTNEQFKNLRFIVLGGEAVVEHDIVMFRNLFNNCKLMNLYGQTESSYNSSQVFLPSNDKIKITLGDVVADTEIVVVDENGEEVSPLQIGEIAILSDNIALGYWNNEQKTSEVFEYYPDMGRMYWTGDLGRLLEDGYIEFVGRKGAQVKIRGFRVELGEIESGLLTHKDIKEAVVLGKKDDTGDDYLCAYMVSEEEVDLQDLRQYLSEELPEYMIPSYFIKLEKMPLTPTGKVDRRALPEPSEKLVLQSEYEAPRNDLEEKLVDIWREVLGPKKIGINSNFFELGGHSLKAITLVSKIYKYLNVEVDLGQIFREPTIKSISNYIQNKEKNTYYEIESLGYKEQYSTSSSQKRMYILNQLNPENTNYNMTFIFKVQGKLDVSKVDKAIKKIIERHDVLRTSFHLINGEIVQKIHEDSILDMKYSRLEECNLDQIIKEFIKPFNLEVSPLLRLEIIELSEQKYILMFDIHHIISDGISTGIFIKEFMNLYVGTEVEPLKIQYRDYCEWENKLLESDTIKKQENYWLEIFKEEVLRLNMPLDYVRPHKQTLKGKSIKFEISSAIIEAVNELTRKKGTTLNIALFSIYNLLLHKYSGQEDITTGLIVAGRNHADLSNLIGVFINFLPIRTLIDSRDTFQEFLDKEKELITSAYDNQNYPFDKIVEKVVKQQDSSRNPLFDSMFILHNQLDEDNVFQIEDLNFEKVQIGKNTTKLDFQIDAFIDEQGILKGSLEYNVNLFKEETMREFTENFEALIKKVLQEPQSKISDINIFDEEEIEIIEKKRSNNVLSKKQTSVVITSTFTDEPIGDYIKWWCKQFNEDITIESAPYNQVFQQLLDNNSLVNKNNGMNLVMVRFEDWIRVIKSEEERLKTLETNFNDLISALNNKQNEATYLVTIFPVGTHLGLSNEVMHCIENLNIKLQQALKTLSNAHEINLRDIASLYNVQEIFDPIRDKEGHIPYTDEYYAVMGTVVARKICAIKKPPFKVIVLDCDNTLWKGICGEDGVLGVKVEESFRYFQEFLIEKYNQGIILTLCSKNNEKDVWEVFDENPDMLLKKEHLVSWRINWRSKSENIKEMAEELNLGLNSFIFIDDSIVECSEVMMNCPQVLTLQLPYNHTMIPNYLKHVWALDREKITEEDSKRNKMYVAERERKNLLDKKISLENFLQSLQLKISMRSIEDKNIVRASQLTQRTNQFNLSTIRRTEQDLKNLLKNENIECWVINVEDRFGEYGMVGLIIAEKIENTLFIDSFLLSCRVLGRRIEEAILFGFKKYCTSEGLQNISMKFYPTGKNKPFKDFIEGGKWIKIEGKEEYLQYELKLEDIEENIESFEFYYDCSYKKDELDDNEKDILEIDSTTQVESSLIINFHEKTLNKPINIELNWSMPIVNSDELLHLNHLLALSNYSGHKLLNLKVHEEVDEKLLIKQKYEAPRNEVEEELVRIWLDILKVDSIGINDNFFNLGGHSLKATSLISKIHKEFNVEIPLIEVFQSPTLKQMGEYIRNSEKNIYEDIVPVKEEEYYEVSSAQKRMYMLYKMNEKSIGYNMPGSMLIDGSLDIAQLEETFKKLIARHETLRTFFKVLEGKIVQIVNKEVEFSIDYLEKTEKTVEEILKGFVRAFDLSKAPLLRVNLVKLLENKYLLMFDMHHIISDGTSMGILMNEFVMIYEGKELEKLKVQYKDFSAWQNKFLQSEEMKKQEEYWLQRFSHDLPVLNMPTDFVRPSLQSFEGHSISFKLDNKLTNNLNNIEKETGSTMYMILLSGVNILLSKYSGQEDIIVGSPVAGRPHDDLNRIIGMFVNTLAMRNYPKGVMCYGDFLKEVKENSLKSYENQQYQFEELVNKLNVPRDISRNPLFDVMLIMQNMDNADEEIKELAFKQYIQERKTAKVDLTFTAKQIGKEVLINLEYCTKLFKRETIERMKEHFVNILEETSSNLEIKLNEINILPEEEKHKLLYDFNNTYVEYNKNKTIYELFEEQVERTPEDIAVVFQEKKLTYRELNENSNQFARVLIDRGVRPDTIVGIMVERSLEMIIGILGILKSGGAYLPIDFSYPQERIEFMLEDSNIEIIVTQKDLALDLKVEVQRIEIDEESMFQGKKVNNIGKVNAANNLAYVIYTSGSTGNPKGVMVEHAQVNNFIQGVTSKINFESNQSILCLTTICFDIFALETLVPLVKGLKVVVANENEQIDAAMLNSIIINNKIDMLQSTPSRLKLLMSGKDFSDSMKTITTIMIGGEAFPINLLKELNVYDNLKIYNMYGPTESTVWSTIKDLTTSVEINIGKPISNTQIYILGKNNEVQPLGVAGEMYIAGDGVTRGYVNRSDLTEEKFLLSPFAEGKRMYRTGDLARWLPDGDIEYLCRTDNQVKIRGYRIELGDIETQLLQYESVKEVIVIVKEDDEIKVLCAYLTAEKELTISELRKYLSNKLPEYMIPSYFIQIEKFPLTPNGKADRKMLEQLQADLTTGIEYEAARNEVEEKLVHIWSEILRVDNIGINDNFFNLGGHSLKATSLIAKIYKELNVEIPLMEIFKAPTLKDMSEYITNSEKSAYEAIVPAPERAYYPTSSSQNRMYILNKLNPENTNYNMPFIFKVQGKLDTSKVDKVIRKIIERHDVLRTSFHLIDGEIMQKVHKESILSIKYSKLEEENLEKIIKSFIKPFRLEESPLLRLEIAELSEQKYILLFDIHHIISDGFSTGIFIKEFMDLYKGSEVEPLKIQYRDYCAWEKKLLESDTIRKQENYWLETFKQEVLRLNMPLDYVRPHKQTFNGNSIKFEISEAIMEAVNEVTRKKATTLNIVLFSIYNLLLHKYSGQEDITTGLIVAGRNHADLSKLIGVFINFLPIRTLIDSSNSFEEFLEKEKQIITSAYDNQNYAFDEIVAKVVKGEDTSRNPLFDSMFILHNQHDEDTIFQMEDLNFERVQTRKNSTKLDFQIDAFIDEQGNLKGSLEYNVNLFKEETMREFTENFKVLIKKVLQEPQTKISDINIFDEEEIKIIEKKRSNNLLNKNAMPLVITSTFTDEPIGDYIKWWCKQFNEDITIEFAPYNQVFQQLLDNNSLVNKNNGMNLVMVRFEDWIRGIKAEKERLKILKTNFNDLILALKNKQSEATYLVAIFPVDTHLELSNEVIHFIEDLNVNLQQELRTLNNVYEINLNNIANLYNVQEIFDAIRDREGHIPYTDEYFAVMGTAVVRKICAIKKAPFKVIVLDCDNTLWKGICGEDGALGIKVEEAFEYFQKFLIAKYNQGIMLTLCSKNNESDVWEVFDENPNMLLKKEHLVSWRINWHSKSENIREMAEELNLGLDSFIFIDDSIVECSEVMTNCPQVLTLQLPYNPIMIPNYLEHVWAFDREKVTEEDIKRNRMYVAERERKNLINKKFSLENFLQSLQLKISMRSIEDKNIVRASQLTQRTNQFNLSTIRRTEQDLKNLLKNENVKCWVINVKDRFGEYGLVGLIIAEKKEKTLFIDSFLLSCRVLGRRIENVILHGLRKYCISEALENISFKFYPTGKNKPFKDFIESVKWIELEEKEKYYQYELKIENIEDEIDSLEFYYDCSYGKAEIDDNENAILEVAGTIQGSSNITPNFYEKTLNGAISNELNWNVPIVNSGELVHLNHLLVLNNHSGHKLLRLKVHEEVNEKLLIKHKYEAPRNEVEEKLVNLWSGILRVDNIGINDSFFSLGGHSLKATSLISKIHKEFNVEIPLIEIFKAPTLKEMAEYILKSEKDIYEAIKPVEEKEYYEVSSAQKRMYMLYQFNTKSLAYNMHGNTIIEGKLSIEKLEEAFINLVERHEAFRTSFEILDGDIVQKINKESDFKIDYIKTKESDIEEKVNSFIKPFILSKAPLLRVGLINLQEDKYILMFDMHHIISDGVSMGVLIKEFADLYSGKKLEEFNVQYKDYAAWQNKLLKSPKIKNQEKYWLSKFDSEIPVLNMRTDYERGEVQSFSGDRISFTLQSETVDNLKNLADKTGSTMYMILLSIYNVLLHKYTEQEDIIVGSPIAGRVHENLQNVIGVFINTLAMRNHPKKEKSFKNFLLEVKQNTLEAYENADYQFDDLVFNVKNKGNSTRNPIFSTMLILQNMDVSNVEFSGLKMDRYNTVNNVSMMDITLIGIEDMECIIFNLEYCTRLFEKETMEQFIDSFIRIVDIVSKDENINIGDIQILDKDKKYEIVTAIQDLQDSIIIDVDF